MRSDRLWIGAACGVALALAAVVAVDAGTESAGAQAGFTVSAEQLKINQSISSAAVKRSNRSLNYLAPIRTTQSDNADDGSDGVKPLSGIPGAGAGWTSAQLARGQKQLWINVGPTGAVTGSSGPATGTGVFTSTRTAVGNYVVDFKTNISACSWSANTFFPTPPGAPLFAFPIGVAGQPTQVNVRTFDAAAPPAPADANFTVQLLC